MRRAYVKKKAVLIALYDVDVSYNDDSGEYRTTKGL